MASSSTSSDPKTFKYAVFLSFRGEDTRNNFVAHLHSALKRHCIHTFKDNKNMEKGERISTELIKAIEDSRFHIIVFSRNYASSSWCLDELVKIMECQKTTEQKAYPIFYDVEPTEVRKQIGAFGEAFAENEKKEDAWKRALTEAANLSGFTLKGGDEAEFIDEIVGKISLELPSIKFSDVEKFIGMEARIRDVVSSLKTGVNEIRMIGIKGMGGAGKTTLAKAVFDQISRQFKHKIFVENVREKVSKDSSGLETLQKQVLSEVLKVKDIEVTGVTHGKLMMKEKMWDKEVLLVLDDVDDIEQLKALAEPSWFMQGSVIIITTRDEGVLRKYGMNSNSIHGVNLLSNEEAVRLFSWHAFGIEIPIPDQNKELSRQVVRYAAGLPLTIRVLGLDFKGKDEDEWKDTLERLEKIPLEETLQRLELSYTSLEPDYKDIFLDVACFWKGKKKDVAIRALECCQLHAKAGLSVLERKSLITVSKYGSLEMHDSIQEMGWDIVRRDHRDEPQSRSRLWDTEEIEYILANDLGSEATRGIKLWRSNLNPSIIMKGLKYMKKLRFLQVLTDRAFLKDSNDGSDRDSKLFDEVNEYFPNALRYLYCDGYPFSSLPITFQASNLVGLYMSHSNLVELWEGGERKVFPKLRFLELSYSRLKTLDLGLTPALDTLCITDRDSVKKLHMSAKCLKLKSLDITGSKLTTLDLEGTPNLETLRLSNCVDLVKLQNLSTCLKLKSIDMVCMIKLTTLNLEGDLNLETLYLRDCSDLVELQMPAECLTLKSIDIRGSKLTTLDLGGILNLETLSLDGCKDLELIRMPLKCPKLKTLNLSGSKLETLRLRTPNLESINLEECYHLVVLHMLDEFPKLKDLILRYSKLRTLNLEGALNLKTLYLRDCSDLVELQMPAECLTLKSIDIRCSKLSALDLGGVLNLETLSLEGSKDFELIRMPLKCPKLKTFNLSGSKLETLKLQTPNLESLNLQKCYHLVVLQMLDECPKLKDLILRYSKLKSFNLTHTPNLETLDLGGSWNLVKLHTDPIGCLKQITKLNLSGCWRFGIFEFINRFEFGQVSVSPELKLFVESVHKCPLHPDDGNLAKFRFNCLYVEDQPSLIGNLEKLISVGLCVCTKLESFYESICDLRDLRKLTLIGDIPEVPKDLGRLGSLEELTLSSTEIKHLPDSICMLQRLKFLTLESCPLLEKLPEDLGRLGYLEELMLSSTKIKHLPDSICMLQRLKFLKLESCHLLEKLPEDLVQLKCLEQLTLSDCKSLQDIPDNICKMKRLEYLGLCGCIAVEKLPEELGSLGNLKELDIRDTRISHLPQSIVLFKDLHIFGSELLLQSCSFTTWTPTSDYETFCYKGTHSRSLLRRRNPGMVLRGFKRHKRS